MRLLSLRLLSLRKLPMSALDLLFVIVLWLQLQLGNSVEFTNRYHKDNKLNHNSYNNYNNHNNHNHNNHNNAIGKKNHYNSHLISTLVFNNSVTTEQIDYSQRNAYDYEIILQTAHPSIDRQHAVSKKYKIWDHPANVFAGSNVYLLTTNTNSNTDSNTAIDSPTVTEVAEYIHNGGGNTMILPEVPPASSQIHFVIMFLLLPPTISGSIPADVQLTDELLHQLLTKMKFPIHLRIRTVIVYKDRIVYPLGVKFTLPTLREAFVEIVRRSAALKFVKTEVAIDTILNGHVNINDYCYFFGGYSRDDNEVLKTISVYSLVDKEPKLLRTIPFVQDLPLATSAITTDGVRYIYLAAGVSGPKLSGGSKWVYRFDIFTESFKELPPLPENRQSGTLTLFRNKLHYIGGSVDREMTVGMVTHYTMDLSDYNNLKWEVATPLPFSRVSHHTVVLKNENNEESLYVVGKTNYFLPNDTYQLFQ